MFIKINLKDFSIEEAKSDNLYRENHLIFGFEGNCWIKNKAQIPSPKDLLYSYRKTKENLLNTLEGNFLFFVINLTEKTLEIYTDIIGSLPLYYTINSGYLTCCTSQKLLLKKNQALDGKNLFVYNNLGYFPPPLTVFDGIKKIIPGYSISSYKNPIFINKERKLNGNPGLPQCLKSIKENINNYCKNGGKVGILFTGGLDSSLLAFLAKDLKPHLYFASIIDASTREYNTYSVARCYFLSKAFNLKFDFIPVKKEEYLKGFLKINEIIEEPLGLDEDLPAVYAFFKKIGQEQKIRYLLSGIGSNELFDYQKNALKKHIYQKMPLETSTHKKLADHFGFDFYAPYLNSDLISYAFNTPLEKRKGKAPLKRILESKNILPREYICQPSLHSQIPPSFINILRTLHGKPNFKQIALESWLKLNLRAGLA